MADPKINRKLWRNGDDYTVCVTCEKYIKMGVNESPHNRECKHCAEDSRMSAEHNFFQYLDGLGIEERIRRLEKVRYENYGEEY